MCPRVTERENSVTLSGSVNEIITKGWAFVLYMSFRLEVCELSPVCVENPSMVTTHAFLTEGDPDNFEQF